MASKGRPFRTVSFEGFEILVGKGDVQNDRLTFDIAEPEDFWLHVVNVPGSHVVVRNPDQLAELPPDVLQHAARLAAWHSKARGSRGKVESPYLPGRGRIPAVRFSARQGAVAPLAESQSLFA